MTFVRVAQFSKASQKSKQPITSFAVAGQVREEEREKGKGKALKAA
jgi:hypothetical protein